MHKSDQQITQPHTTQALSQIFSAKFFLFLYANIVTTPQGRVGENYNIGGNCEKTNLEVVKTICQLLEKLAPNKPNHIKYYEDLMTFVKDRPGHDVRYSLDCSKIYTELGWRPQITFEQGLRQTVKWYLENNR